MTASWEYTRVSASLTEGTHPGKSEAEIKETAGKEWIDLLNRMGKSGWELVSERVAFDGEPAVGTFWVEFSGTLKRQSA